MSVTSHSFFHFIFHFHVFASEFTLLKTTPGNHLYTQCPLKFTSFFQSNKGFHLYSVYLKECISTNRWLVDFSFMLVNVMHHSAPLGKWTFFLSRDIKQRQVARTPYVVFVVASHYQSLRIIVLLLQTCLSGRLQQDRRFRLFASLFCCFLKTECCKFLKGNSRDVFSIPFPLKGGFGDLFIFWFLRFRIEFALLLLALYKGLYVSQFRSKFGDRRGIFELKIFRIPLFSRGEYSHSLIFLIILVFKC